MAVEQVGSGGVAEADPEEMLQSRPEAAGGGAGGCAQGALRGVRGRGAEPLHRPYLLPRPPGVPAAAASGGGRVRLRPPHGRPHHPLRGGRLPLPHLHAPMTYIVIHTLHVVYDDPIN